MADITRMHRNSDGVFDLFYNEVAKTADYTILPADNGTLFTNTGASGAVVFTLPVLTNGYFFGFMVTADQSVTIASAAGSDMVVGNSATASSVAITTSGQKIGVWVKVYSNLDGTKWYVEQFPPQTIGLSGTELGFLDGVTAGTGAASKALVLDSSGNVAMPTGGAIDQRFYESVTTTNVITVAENGKVFFLNSATEFVSTLPAVASSAGVSFTFIVKAAPSGASYTIVTNSSENKILGHVVCSQDAGGTADSETSGGDTITLVDSKAVVGDRVDLVCDGAFWYARCTCKVFDAITITTAS